MRMILALAALSLAACSAAPQIVDVPPDGEVIVLPVDGATGAGGEGVMMDDPRFGRIVRNVDQPTLTVYFPDADKATGAAMIIAPGGGFHMLSIENEGTAVANWLKDQGVAAFVLRYRLVKTGDDFAGVLMRRLFNRKELDAAVAPVMPLAAADGEAAVRYVRDHAAAWGVKPDRVGIVGFSAGGAVTVMGLEDGAASERPDFAAAIYPGLLPDPIAVPANAPPLFVAVADDDALARGDSGRLAEAWKAAGRPVSFVAYPNGGHGFGMAPSGKSTDAWLERFRGWLGEQGVLAR